VSEREEEEEESTIPTMTEPISQADTETIFNDQTANRRQPSVRGWTWRPGEDAET